VLNKIKSNNQASKRISSQSLTQTPQRSDKLVVELEQADQYNTLESQLLKLPEVSSVQRNYPYKSMYVPNDPLFASSWQQRNTGFGNKVESAWDSVGTALGVVGACSEATPLCGGQPNVKIAVIDSGVQQNIPEFDKTTFANPAEFYYSTSPCVLDSYVLSWGGEYLCRSNVQDDICPTNHPVVSPDDCGHGTAVASIIAGSDNAIGTVGIAYNTTIMPIAIKYAFDSVGLSQAIQYARINGANVINLSLGTPFDEFIVKKEIQNARDAGIIVVASSGNCGSNLGQECFDFLSVGDPGYNVINPIVYPAYYPETVSVGAINQNGTRSSYSTFNDRVDIVAPIGTGYPIAKPNGQFNTVIGTSFSAPQVAGVAGLFKSVRGNTNSSHDDFLNTISLNSTDIGPTGKDNQFGYGNLNANLTAVGPNPRVTNLAGNYNFNSNVSLNISDSSGLTLTQGLFRINGNTIETRNNPANLNKTIDASDLVTGNNTFAVTATANGGSKGATTSNVSVSIPWSTWYGIGEMFGPASSVVIGNRVVQTVQGTGNWIYTRYSDDEGQTWSTWLRDGQMFSPASTVVINNRIVQTVRGTGDWIYTRHSDNQGQTWTTWVRDGQMYDKASSIVIGNRIVQTVRGTGDWIYTRYSDNQGQSWTTWQRAGQMYSEASSIVIGTRIVQTVQGTGNWIYTRYSDNQGQTWSIWLKDGQMFSPAATTVIGSRILQAVRGSSNDLYTRHSDNQGQSWSIWRKHGKTVDAPDLIQVNNQYAILTFRDPNTDIGYMTYKANTGWSVSAVFVGKMLNASSTNFINGVLIQTVRGTDNKIYTRRFTSS
jgi:hypothetical protein